MKIALVQRNYTVVDLQGNADRITEFTRRTWAQGARKGFEEAAVRQVLHGAMNAEFKLKQAAPGIKVTDRAFGSGWRMPIVRRDWESMIPAAKSIAKEELWKRPFR